MLARRVGQGAGHGCRREDPHPVLMLSSWKGPSLHLTRKRGTKCATYCSTRPEHTTLSHFCPPCLNAASHGCCCEDPPPALGPPLHLTKKMCRVLATDLQHKRKTSFTELAVLSHVTLPCCNSHIKTAHVLESSLLPIHPTQGAPTLHGLGPHRRLHARRGRGLGAAAVVRSCLWSRHMA